MPDNQLPVALVLESEKKGRGKILVRCRIGGQVIYCDELIPSRVAERTRFISDIRGRFPTLEADVLDAELMKLTDQATASAVEDDEEEAVALSPQKLLESMPAETIRSAEAMLLDPMLIQRIQEDLTTIGIAGEIDVKTAVYLTGTSRLLHEPLAIIVQGPSSSGKSYTLEKTAELFPEETVLLVHSMTPQALIHMPSGNLVHRFIVAGERKRIENDETAETTRSLREMLSSRRLSKLMVVKIDGKFETKLIEQEGPIAYAETTTMSMVFDEDQNRCLMIHTDERPEQTRLIMHSMVASHGSDAAMIDTAIIKAKHHALQRILACELQNCEIQIPFLASLAAALPSDRVEIRRALTLLISTIKACALLHFRQRRRDAVGRILANLDDYRIVYNHLRNPFREVMGGALADCEVRFLQQLHSHFAQGQFRHGEFTTTQAVDISSKSKSTISGWLAKLREAGYVQCTEPNKGPKPARWQLTHRPLSEALSVLPSPDSLRCDVPEVPTQNSLPNELPEETRPAA